VRPLAAGEAGLPLLPKLDLVLHRAAQDQSPATERLAAIILQALRPSLGAYGRGQLDGNRPMPAL
jgi:hypothetical protein